MKNMTLSNLAAACKGTLYGTECLPHGAVWTREASCVVIDSRKIEAGGIFIATRGERVDGHEFIPGVLEQGALGVICEQKPEEITAPCIVVADSFQALKDVAEYYRKQLSVQVVGITGSVGKTSTKEFIASVLAQKYNVLKTQGNFNNEVGLPLTVLSIRQEHQVAVLEMGISDFGEMHRLSKIAKPDICVITNIGQSHLENLGSREGILKAKSEIFDFMNPDGYVLVNGDDDLLVALKKRGNHEVIHFGLEKNNEIYASDVISKGLFGSHAVIHGGMQVFSVEIPLPGAHMVLNALAATGVAQKLDLTPAQIQNGIEAVEKVAGRSNVLALKSFTVIDDCYNANPVSMCAALDLLTTALGRKIAILGDMFELGEEEKKLHEKVGVYAARKEIDVLICVGTLSEHMYHGAMQKNELSAAARGQELHFFENRQAMLDAIPHLLQTGDTILVKASHGMHFEKVVEAIRDLDG